METLRDIALQELNEYRFSRKHIDPKIRIAIETDESMQAKIKQGIELIQAYQAGQYYESKMVRIAQLEHLDIATLVLDVFVGIAYCYEPELFTSVSAQMASRLKFSDKGEAITTVAEILAVLCITDAFDITKQSKMGSLMVVSRIPLPENLMTFIQNSQHLPPMICEPLELTNNYSSGYLTHNESLVLGQGNHHEGDLCLDVLNKMNRVALKLDTEFLSQVEETPSEITEEKIIAKALKKGKYLSKGDAKERVRLALENWDNFKNQSYEFYRLMVQQGNRIWLTHKVDKRGRIYAVGYHLSTMGTPFKKASLELQHEELVDGVPS